jgi:acetyltransferase-like isoleucine patch superfamily enzyme
MTRNLARVVLLPRRAWQRLLMYLYRPLFRSHGRHFRFDPRGVYSFETIEVGDDVFIGPGAVFTASRSAIRIGNKVMFGPSVAIIGGDHNTSVVGRFMHDVGEKRPDDDQAVVIEDDVWVGARSTILKGVRIGRGAIVAAGAVVTKDIPPYGVVAGVPARVIRFRWDVDTILRHEEAVYPPEARLARAQLETWLGRIGSRHPMPALSAARQSSV